LIKRPFGRWLVSKIHCGKFHFKYKIIELFLKFGVKMKLIRVLGLCLSVKVILSFPESGDPITEEPKLVRPNTEAYVATIFENAPCSSWDLILTSQYTPPPTTSWSRVVLDFSVS